VQLKPLQLTYLFFQKRVYQLLLKELDLLNQMLVILGYKLQDDQKIKTYVEKK